MTGMVHEGKKWLDRMRQLGLTPNYRSYLTLFRAQKRSSARSEDCPDCLRIIFRFTALGCSPYFGRNEKVGQCVFINGSRPNATQRWI